jgi:hypothetical protein
MKHHVRLEILPLVERLEFLLNENMCDCNCQHISNLLYAVRNTEIPDHEEEIRKLAENNWSVINCDIGELEKKLRKLGPGRKQIAVARYEDQVTVVVNELDIVW